MKKTVTTMGKCGPQPHLWLVGPDTQRHDQFIAWQRAYSQAQFRGEPWFMTFEDFCTAWEGHWQDRGRGSDQLCLTRQDLEGPWSLDNVYLITRAEHNRRHQLKRTLSKRKRSQQRCDSTA